MADVTRSTEWVTGDVLTADALNAEFNNLLNALALVNADISGSAGIIFSKLDSTTVAGVTATQTLTNKTLTKPKVTQPYTDIVTATDGATVTLNLSLGNVQTVTIAGNRTLALSNEVVGQAILLTIVQDGTGGRTVTFWSGIKWVGGVTPTLTSTASKADTFGFLVTSAGAYYGYIVGQNL